MLSPCVGHDPSRLHSVGPKGFSKGRVKGANSRAIWTGETLGPPKSNEDYGENDNRASWVFTFEICARAKKPPKRNLIEGHWATFHKTKENESSQTRYNSDININRCTGPTDWHSATHSRIKILQVRNRQKISKTLRLSTQEKNI